jgi:hypothetical protein
MLGLNRDVGPDGRAFFEYLRIEESPDGIVYVASPRGGAATSFKLIACTAGRAVFENRAHDFPQRITYDLTAPDRLAVTIEGDAEGKTRSVSWSWTRKPGSAAPTDGGDR